MFYSMMNLLYGPYVYNGLGEQTGADSVSLDLTGVAAKVQDLNNQLLLVGNVATAARNDGLELSNRNMQVEQRVTDLETSTKIGGIFFAVGLFLTVAAAAYSFSRVDRNIYRLNSRIDDLEEDSAETGLYPNINL